MNICTLQSSKNKTALAGRVAISNIPVVFPGENRRIRNSLFQICMPLPLVLLIIVSILVVFSAPAAPADSRPRILVCTDIGGTDFDDFQSMVHLLVYADRFDIEGLISSPTGGPGREADILKVIKCYAHDYPNLKTYSDKYPAPEALRAICKQGALHSPGLRGYGKPTEGSKWIIKCAERPDPRPLWILEWAGIDDVAQALHDDPAIESKIRVYFIGGPNKKWSVPAYYYLMRHHPKLWIIENNSTYRGWFVGGDQHDEWSNAGFVASYVAGRGALGDFFAGLTFNGKSSDYIKMGDTPSVAYMLGNDPGNPVENKSWGGQFVRAWDRPYKLFDHAEANPPTAADKVETFGVVEIRYHLKTPDSRNAEAALVVDGQRFTGFAVKEGVWHFLFSPKTAKSWKYKIESTLPGLTGKTGAFTSYWPTPDLATRPSSRCPNWWTDNPDPALADDGWQGARTISKYRVEFLRDFAARMERCKVPAQKSAHILHGDDGWDPTRAVQIPEANRTAPSSNATPSELNRTLPILFIVGDSTVHNSAPGLLGWGDVLGRFFDTNKIIVENHAKPGRSSRTFQTQGWWAPILAAGRPGDFVLIQMGDNDSSPVLDDTRCRGSIRGIGNESREIYNPVQKRKELVHTYGWYMRKYVSDARAKGMTPIICSPVPRLPKHIVKAGDVDKTGYVKWSAEIAYQEQVYFIPLNHLVLTNYIGMTPQEIKAKYFTTHDNTHASPTGAMLNASEVVAGLRALNDCPLKEDLLKP